MLAGLTFYLNGYTGPRISDLELKRLIAIHGGNVRFAASTSCSYHANIHHIPQLPGKLVVHTHPDYQEPVGK